MEVLEEWRDVVGYEGLYEVSSLGRVRSYHGKNGVRYLTCSKNAQGYICFILYKNGRKKGFLAHRLVWETFRGPIPLKYEIDHVNTVRDDNRLSNLRCVSPKENQNNSLTLSNMREAAKKRSQNPEWLKKVRETVKKLSEDPQWRQKSRESRVKVLSKPILQINRNTGEVIREWPSATDAARDLGINRRNISSCCHGRYKTVGGYRWCFALAKDS